MAAKQIQISIPGTETKQGTVFYLVEIKCDGKKWTCLKRYSKFDELNNNLIKSDLRSKIPSGCELPPKKWSMSSHSPQFIEKRRVNLEMYVTRLVTVKELVVSDPFQTFINSDQSGKVTTTTTTTEKNKITEETSKAAPIEQPFKAKSESVVCTCGLPLCVCKPDIEEEKKEEPEKIKKEETKKSAPPAKVEKKKVEKSAATGSLFAGFGSTPVKYNFNENLNEQCRDAIKSGDNNGLKALLEAKADCNFQDRTGNTLSHLAAMFNRYEAISMLIEGGANIWAKNPRGETAVSYAPTALAHKMKALQPEPQK